MSTDRRENQDRDALNVYVNGRHFSLLKGMTVRHALLAAGLLSNNGETHTVWDEWGNLTGSEGALTEGVKLFTAP